MAEETGKAVRRGRVKLGVYGVFLGSILEFLAVSKLNLLLFLVLYSIKLHFTIIKE